MRENHWMMVLVLIFFCSGCATLGYNPGKEARTAFFQSKDWTKEDKERLATEVKYSITPYRYPIQWTSDANKKITYGIIKIKDGLRSGYWTKDVTLMKTNTETGETATVEFRATAVSGSTRTITGSLKPTIEYVLHID